MKTFMLTIALAMGTTAIAQTTPPPGEPMNEPTPDSTTTEPMQEPMTEPTQPMDPNMTPAPPADTMTPPPPAADMPMAPAGPVTVNPSVPVSQAFPPPAPRTDYPVCSRTVTDGCVQRAGSPRPPGSPRN